MYKYLAKGDRFSRDLSLFTMDAAGTHCLKAIYLFAAWTYDMNIYLEEILHSGITAEIGNKVFLLPILRISPF